MRLKVMRECKACLAMVRASKASLALQSLMAPTLQRGSLSSDAPRLFTAGAALIAFPRRSVGTINFADRYCDLSALVVGDEALFGAVPMEMMDLVLHPASQTLVVNPESPFLPVALMK